MPRPQDRILVKLKDSFLNFRRAPPRRVNVNWNSPKLSETRLEDYQETQKDTGGISLSFVTIGGKISITQRSLYDL